MDVKGKSILITGAGRGLGRALALKLASQGARLALVSRTPSDLESLVREIREQNGEAFAIEADVGQKDSIYPIVGQAAALAGPIDILINNASTLGPVPLRLVADTDCEDFEQALQVNLLGPFRLMKAVVGSMVLRQTGLVINVSSDAAIEAYPTWGIYSASKAALEHLTRIAAAEFLPTSVRFLIVDPGEMNTKMHSDAMPDADPDSLRVPAVVADEIASIIHNAEQIESGSRIIVSEWKVSDGIGKFAA